MGFEVEFISLRTKEALFVSDIFAYLSFIAGSITRKERVDHIPVEDNPVYMTAKKIDLKKLCLFNFSTTATAN